MEKTSSGLSCQEIYLNLLNLSNENYFINTKF